MRINSKPETKEDARTGRYTIRTRWAANRTQLISAVSLRTKDSREPSHDRSRASSWGKDARFNWHPPNYG